MPPKKSITVVKASEKKGKGAGAGGNDPKWVDPSDFDASKIDVTTAKETATGLWIPVKYDGRPLRFWTGTVRTPTGASAWDRDGSKKWSCAIAIDPDNESACALSEALGRLHVRLQDILRENSADLGISAEEMAELVFNDSVTHAASRPDIDTELSPLFNAYFPIFGKEFSALFVRTGAADFRVAPGKLQELLPKDTFFMAVVELGGAWFRRAYESSTDSSLNKPPSAGLWFKFHTVRLLTKEELVKVRRPSTQARAMATGLLSAPITNLSSDTDTTPEATATVAAGVPPKKRGHASISNGNGSTATPSPPVDGGKRVRTVAPDAEEVAVMLAEAE
jgi:hypothetical protein